MFKVVVADNKDKITQLAKGFLLTDNFAAAGLCLNRYFTRIRNRKFLKPSSIDQLSSYLELFLAYTRILSDLASPANSSKTTLAERLFGFRRLSAGATHDTFTTLPGTFLHRFRELHMIGKLDNALSEFELQHVLRRAVHEYLWDSVTKENLWFRELPQMASCLDLALPGGSHTTKGHPHDRPVTYHWYNLRIRINLQQILILHTLHTTEKWPTLKAARWWVVGKAFNQGFQLTCM